MTRALCARVGLSDGFNPRPCWQSFKGYIYCGRIFRKLKTRLSQYIDKTSFLIGRRFFDFYFMPAFRVSCKYRKKLHILIL